MIASGCYVAIIVALQLLRLMPGSVFPKVTGNGSTIVMLPGVSGLFLLTANLWIRADWPYLTQLLIALATSMVLYLGFVLTVLSQEQEQEQEQE